MVHRLQVLGYGLQAFYDFEISSIRWPDIFTARSHNHKSSSSSFSSSTAENQKFSHIFWTIFEHKSEYEDDDEYENESGEPSDSKYRSLIQPGLAMQAKILFTVLDTQGK